MSNLYRVAVHSIANVEPGQGTFWLTEKIAYCGDVMAEARRVYRAECLSDGGSDCLYGGPARITTFERLDTAHLAYDTPCEQQEPEV